MTVVIGHLAPITSAPALGVVLFFVISGFLIGKLYIEQEFSAANVWRYGVGRVARVYPLFALVIIATGLLNHTTEANVFLLTLADVPRHLLLAGSGLTVWTISTEFQFYGLFIAIWLVRSLTQRAHLVIALLLAGSVVVMLVRGGDAGRIEIFGYLHIFAFGLAIAAVTSGRTGQAHSVAVIGLPVLLVAYMAAFLAVPYFYPPRWIYMDLMVVSGCGLLLAATMLAGDSLPNRLLSLPLFVWLGEISFGVYLLHRHAEWTVNQVLVDVSAWLTFPLKIALALALAQLANWLIENPCRSALRRAGEKPFRQKTQAQIASARARP